MNRKAFAASYVVDFYAYLLFVIIIIFFFFYISWSGTPLEGKIITEKHEIDATHTLINALNQHLGELKTTPAEIIRNEDIEHAEQFQTALRIALRTAYPPKNAREYFWLRVYTPAELSEKNPCLRLADSGKYFRQNKGFVYGTRHDTETPPLFSDVHVPLKNSVEYAIVILCIDGAYFT